MSHGPQGQKNKAPRKQALEWAPGQQTLGLVVTNSSVSPWHNHPLMCTLKDKWKLFLPPLPRNPSLARVLNSKNIYLPPLPQLWTTLKGHPAPRLWPLWWDTPEPLLWMHRRAGSSPSASLSSSGVMLLRTHLSLIPENLCLTVYFLGNPI